MQHIDSYAADPRTVMPQQTNPKDLTIDLNSHEQALNRPASNPITIPGIDLSSVEGGVGLTSLPALPSSPPTSRRPAPSATGLPGCCASTCRSARRD